MRVRVCTYVPHTYTRNNDQDTEPQQTTHPIPNKRNNISALSQRQNKTRHTQGTGTLILTNVISGQEKHTRKFIRKVIELDKQPFPLFKSEDSRKIKIQIQMAYGESVIPRLLLQCSGRAT